MSTRFSRLTNNPEKFWIDLTKTLESKTQIDEYWNSYLIFFDNYNDEYLFPTFAKVLKELSSKHSNLIDIEEGGDSLFEHFYVSCFYYIDIEKVLNNSSELKEMYKNLDKKYEIDIFPEVNQETNKFHFFVWNEKNKKILIDLYLTAFNIGIKLASKDVVNSIISNWNLEEILSTIKNFLNNLIQVNEEFN